MSGLRGHAKDISDYTWNPDSILASLDYDYSYGGTDVSRNDHYGGHSGYHHHSGSYHDEKCCPLVVDAVCLGAILLAIAGSTVFLARTFQIELTGRRKKRFAESGGRLLNGKKLATDQR